LPARRLLLWPVSRVSANASFPSIVAWIQQRDEMLSDAWMALMGRGFFSGGRSDACCLGLGFEDTTPTWAPVRAGRGET
jgi:hypothetical protein